MTQRIAGAVFFVSLAVPGAVAEAGGDGRPRQGEFRVNSYTPGDQFLPRIAARPNGGFVVVWNSVGELGPDAPGAYPGSGSLGVFGRLFNREGHPVGKDFLVNQYTTGQQYRPRVAVAPNGEFVVVWAGYGDGGGGGGYGPGYGVFARQFARDGTPLGGEFQVNTYTTNYQGWASVATTGSGDFVVVWQSSYRGDPTPQDGSGQGVFGRQFAASGVPLGGEFQVNTYTPGNQGYPSLAAAANGGFTVVWQSLDGSSLGIFGRRFDADGTPGAEFRVNSYTPGSQFVPQVSADRDGDFVVAWTGQDGSGSGIFGQRFSKQGRRRGAEFQINSYTSGVQGAPCVASEPDGDFMVAWTSGPENLFDEGQDGSATGVFGQRFDANGSRRGLEFQVNTYTTGFQNTPCVAALPGGDFVVVWQSALQDGSGSGVFGRRFEKPKAHH